MATIKDIAKEANVSLMTVSRVINAPELVKEDTRIKVNEAIERLGYRPNLLAKSLAGGCTRTIGIISSDRYNQAYTDIIASVEKAASKSGYVVINSDVSDSETAKQALNILLGSKVDGIIVTPLEMEMPKVKDYKDALKEAYDFINYFLKIIKNENINVVTVSQKMNDIVDVSFDYETQAALSLNYLLSKGYKDISLINCKFPEGLWLQKENKYKEIMIDNNLKEFINVCHSPLTQDGGKDAMNELLNNRVPKAVYCANDLLAAGAIQAILSKGYRIPEDIAVLGNDDMFMCEHIYPKLSTISLGAKEAGQLAFKTLFDMINGKSVFDQSVKPYLVERNSV